MKTRSRLYRLTILAFAGTVSLVTMGTQLSSAASAAPPSPRTKTVAVGSNPYDVAISQNLGEAFVVNDGSVSAVSLITHRQLAEFSTGGYQGQNGIALFANDTQAYITNYDRNDVVVIDTETRKVRSHITVGTGAVDVVKINTPSGQRGYVAYNNRKQLTGINAANRRVDQHVSLPRPAQTLTAAPGGATVWAGSTYDGHVFLIDTRTGKVTKSLGVGAVGPVTSIAFSPDGRQAWVAGLGGLGILDARTGKSIRFLPITHLFTGQDLNMGAVALTGTGRYAYVENSTFPEQPARGQIAMIDTHSYRVLHHIATGLEPEALAIDTKRNTAYAPNYADDTVTYFPTEK